MKPSVILLLAGTFVLQSCASMDKPPSADGNRAPANSLSVMEMLKDQEGYRIVGDNREKKEVREYFLYGGKRLIAKNTADRQKVHYPAKPAEFIEVDGARLVERTVRVGFERYSTKFEPTPDQQFHIRQLIGDKDLKRIELRGRTDGKKLTAADEKTARMRAESAKRYLLSLGVPSDIITVTYQAGGDFIADNHSEAGSALNRRVEIEAIYDVVSQYADGR